MFSINMISKANHYSLKNYSVGRFCTTIFVKSKINKPLSFYKSKKSIKNIKSKNRPILYNDSLEVTKLNENVSKNIMKIFI